MSICAFRTRQTFSDFVEQYYTNPDTVDQVLSQIDYETWIYVVGGDPTGTLAPLFQNSNIAAAQALMNGYISCAGACSPSNPQQYNSWTSNLQVIFHQTCLSNFRCNAAVMTRIDSDLSITSTATDGEVRQRWYTAGVYNNYGPVMTAAGNWVASMGRNKYLQPIFDACAETGGSVYTTCVGWYNANKNWWTPLSRMLVADILNQP
jgi:hypothetical protein